MNAGKTFFILFIIFLLIISLVNASELTPKTLSGSLCPRETGLFVHSLRNTDDSPKLYTTQLEGSASSWATSVPQSFILASQESRDIFTYVTPLQSVNPGRYDLEIKVSSPGDTKSLKHTINIRNCYGVNIVSNSDSLSSCPNDAVRYRITLTNTGEYTETYNLIVSGNRIEAATFSENSVVLKKGESKEVSLFVNSPVDSGRYNFNVEISSSSGKSNRFINFFLNVNPCYDFKLNAIGNNSYSLCDRSYIVVPLNIKNDGTVINNYNIEINGPEWAQVDKDFISLRDKESESFSLIFAPTYGVYGDYNTKITVIPEKGNLKSVADFNINVRKCHSVDIDLDQDEADSCKGIENNYILNVKNDGEIKKTYNFELTAPLWVSLNAAGNNLTLNPGQEIKLNLSAFPTEEDKEDNFLITVKATANDESGISANDADEIMLNVKSADDCYRPSLETNYDEVIVYYDSSVAIPLKIRNDGIREAGFSLSMYGTASEFSILNTKNIIVKPGENEIVYLYVAPNPNVALGDYSLGVSLYAGDSPVLANKNINIKITDVSDKATLITEHEEGNMDLQNISLWSRFKSWVWRTFAGEEKTEFPNFNTSNFISPNNPA